MVTMLVMLMCVCAGQYDPASGTNFGSCQSVDRSAEIQAPGDAGDSSGK